MPIQPFIFVGVGGTGGKTLGFIRKMLDDTLSRIGWQEGWPDGWQFIHVDVPAEPDANAADTPYALPRTSYVPLTTSRSTYQGFHDAISQELVRSSADQTARYLAWGSWHPEPASAVFVHIPHGAGQYRAIGRVCVLKSLKLVDQAFSRAHDAATLAETGPQLKRIQALVGIDKPSAGDIKPVIFVIGSVSGGSGSGMFLDVCDVLRGQGHDQINSVLFTPEVFERPSGETDPGVAPNTFMALNEVANSMWVHAQADAPLSRDRMFARAGVSSPVGRGGPTTVFLVGRKNRSVTFKDADEVYKIVGRSLGELVLDEKLTSDVVAYDLANAHQMTAGAQDSLNLTPPDGARDIALFRGLGFSRLTVGREFFDRYATDRLLRRVGLRLLEGHLERRLPDDRSSDDELKLGVVKEAWPAFLRDCNLDEVGRANAITDKLDTWNHPEVATARAAFTNKLRNDIAAADTKNIVATEARSTAQTNVRNARESTSQFTSHIVKASRQLAVGLQNEIQETLRRVIVRAIASYGLPVTIDLVDQLIDRSREGAQSLDGERSYVDLKLQEGLAALPQPPAGAPARFPKGSVDDISAIVDDAERVLRRHTLVFAQTLAKDLLDDLITNLLQPWRRALSDVNGLLRLELRPDVGLSPLELWPADEGIPDYLRPSKVEFLLDGVDGFPEQFVNVVERSVSGEKGLNAVITATEQIIAGEELKARAPTRPVGLIVQNWIPRSELARPGDKNPAAANVAVTLELDDLKARTHSWLSDQEKYVGQFLRQSLGDYLTDELTSAPELKVRRDRLVGHFQSMITSSLPLVALESRLTNLLHGHEVPPYSLHVSNVNIPDQLSEVRQQIEDAAAALLGTQHNVKFTNTPRADATMMTLLKESYHMLEVSSVMSPLSKQWSRGGAARDFWQYRRSRPLSEWVPLGPEARKALVTGWFTARLLGQASGTNSKGQVELSVTVDGKKHVLPERGVRPSNRRDPVGMLLEGLPVAMVSCFENKNLDGLAAYQHLIKLGSAVDDEENNPVVAWAGGAGGQAADLSGDLAAGATRKDAATALIKRWRAAAEEMPDKMGKIAEAQAHPTFEVYSDLLEALERIQAALNRDDDGTIAG